MEVHSAAAMPADAIGLPGKAWTACLAVVLPLRLYRVRVLRSHALYYD